MLLHHGFPEHLYIANPSRANTFRDGDLTIYRQAWDQPGMLAWHHTALHQISPTPRAARGRSPFLFRESTCN